MENLIMYFCQSFLRVVRKKKYKKTYLLIIGNCWIDGLRDVSETKRKTMFKNMTQSFKKDIK